MEFNLNIKKIGKTSDIFGFFEYLTQEVESKNYCLLESVSENTNEMLFSFIGVKPDFMVKVINEDLKVYEIKTERGEKMKEMAENSLSDDTDYKMPFEDTVNINLPGIEKLKEFFPISRSAMPELFPRKVFSGGLLGYIGYDVVSNYVGYEKIYKKEVEFPDILMGYFSEVLAYSHTTQTIYQINNNIDTHAKNDVTSWIFDKYKRNYTEETQKLFSRKEIKDILAKETNFKSNMTIDEWTKGIEKTKDYIKNGDIIQAVLSRKMIAETDIEPLKIYRALKQLNPSPYMYYLNFEEAHNGDIRIIGSSPEALIRKEHNILETHPIAGTRRRGRNAQDERRMEQELLNSEKELAEHIMLVDLARNDLAKVSVPGTVDTFEFIDVKKYSNVMHLVSKVRSKSYLDPFSIFKSVFPAGTVSGAPKKRAMEIVHDLEREQRGPYAGCVGYFSFTGDMDMAISIRTIFNKNNKYIAQAGAGIVADSDAQEEYLETANKMKGILSTINLAQLL